MWYRTWLVVPAVLVAGVAVIAWKVAHLTFDFHPLPDYYGE